MKRITTVVFVLITITISIAQQGEWTTLKTGAGGWITGMDIHPDGTKFIRSDVGGAYRLDNGSDTWTQLVTSESMPNNDIHWSKYLGVLSIASAPSDVSRTYMAFNNTIYSSNNRGTTWQRTNFPEMEMRPNDDASKLFGERLEVDPNDKNRVYFGSIDDGLFVTSDGSNWQEVADVPSGMSDRGIRSIKFDTSSGQVNGLTKTIYIAVDGEGIFRSDDAGSSFVDITSGLFAQENPWFFDMEIDQNGRLYISGKDEASDGNAIPFGVYRYDGSTWEQIFTTDLDIPYSEIAIDPNDDDRILIFSEGYSETYITTNATSTTPSWAFRGIQRSAQNIPWLAWTETEWFTLGEIEFDPITEDRVWITLGTGTFYIDIVDNQSTLIWNEYSSGQEHLVSNDIVSFSNGNKLTAHWDFPIFLHTPANEYPEQHLPTQRFNSCWDLSQSPTDENFVVALIEDIRYCCWDDESRNSSYSEDGGQTWTKFPSMPGGEFDLIFGQIEVSAGDNSNIVWLPGQSMNPFYSLDKGSTWTEVDLPGDSDACCLDGPWFRRKALAADKVKAGKFYLYDWGAGHIFVTNDGGASWTKNSEVLPAWSFNGKITTVPDHEGHLFFANGPEEAEDLIEGLMRSIDGGSTWTEVPATSKIINVTVGKAAPGATYPTIFLCGEVNGVYGYYQSTDNCESWSSLGKYPMGIYDWPVAFEGNLHKYGNVAVGFAGNGFVQYQTMTSEEPVVTERIHVDQFGYQPEMTKIAVISDPQVGYNAAENYTPGSTMQVVREADETVVFSGSPTIWNGGQTHDQSGDKGWQFDFSTLTTPGSYYLLDETNNGKSYTFEISEAVYDEVLKAATKMFYYNRCNMPKETPYAASNWTDSNNFLNDLQDANARYIYDQGNASLEKDLTGGWFDAGDYNKYVTFAHGAVHNLLSAYDENAAVFADDWNIPESGNGVPDLLDEVKWELDWLQKMTNPDGTVHIKMGSKNYSENTASPPSANTDQRYYGPICSAASVAVASIFSHAAKTYQGVPTLQSYANDLEATAISTFDHYLTKLASGDLDTGCDDGSIVAGDADWNEPSQMQNALIAAVYLYDLTNLPLYGDYVRDHINDAEAVNTGWMGPYTNQVMEALFHYTTLTNADGSTADAIINSITPHVSQDWDGFYGQNDQDLYRAYMPDFSYHWGSNQIKADYANLNSMVARYNINPSANDSYLQKSEEMIHYYHGVNPITKVYLSNMAGFGAENSVNEIYHTWFADGTDYDNVQSSLYGPAPGFIPGGPNQNYSFDGNTPPYGQPSQKSYADFNTGWPDASWEITEPAIYYQAAYIRMLANYASAEAVLPVVLSSFEAIKDGDDVDLTWVAESSVNADRFEIESGTDGTQFNTIGEVQATTTSSTAITYEYTDFDVDSKYGNPDFIYYRLKMIDLDDNFDYSEIRVVGTTSTKSSLDYIVDIYPNPAHERLYIESPSSQGKIRSYQIYDILGRPIKSGASNQHQMVIDVSQVNNGNYIIEIDFGDQRIYKKFTKS